MKENFAFWVQRDRWPRAIDHVFLADAVQRIGSQMVRGWKPTDPIVDGTSKESRVAHGRFLMVQRLFADGAARGDLKTGTRATEGGAILPLEPTLWQTEGDRLQPRFNRCQMNPAQPFLRNTIAGANWRYIFVTADSLASFLTVARPAKTLTGLASGVAIPATGVVGHDPTPASNHGARRGRRKGNTYYSSAVPQIILKIVEQHEGWPDKEFDPSWNRAALILEVQTECKKRKQLSRNKKPPSGSTLKRYIERLQKADEKGQ
jgi:hypothetical protein